MQTNNDLGAVIPGETPTAHPPLSHTDDGNDGSGDDDDDDDD